MKESRTAWNHFIPTEWSEIKFKYIAFNKKEIVGKNYSRYDRLALTLNGVVKRSKDDLEGLQPKDFEGYQILRENDFVFKMIDLANVNTSRVGLSPFTGLVSPAYIRYSLKDSYFNKFVYWYLYSMWMNEIYNQLGNSGVRSALNARDMGELFIPLPFYECQKKIACFLDEKIESIDLAIKNAENEIDNVRKIKQDYISKYVISGLKSINKKDSKNKFIGLIPSHWNIGKIKNHCYLKGRIGWQGLTADEYKDEGPYLITGTDLIDGSVNWNTCVHITEKRYEEARQIQIKNGDLLITKDGTIGKLALVSELKDKASLNSGVMLIRNKSNEYLTKYLMYCLTSDYFWDWYNYNQRGQTSIKHLYQEQFETFQFPLPPIEEQQEIIDFLDNKCEVLDKLLKVKYMKLETLKEYKKSLIYECVTGKKEVV